MTEKILAREQLVAAIAAERAAGRTVAVANGCFDLLHVGHIRYLRAASREADCLLVAINDDAVAAMKGPGRPILPAGARAELVAAIRGVKYVTVFSDPTVAPLLSLLRPDVHCKGTDYTVETVPERETVLAYGGRIAIVGDPKQHSTRDLLARLRRLDSSSCGSARSVTSCTRCLRQPRFAPLILTRSSIGSWMRATAASLIW